MYTQHIATMYIYEIGGSISVSYSQGILIKANIYGDITLSGSESQVQ